MLKQFAVSSFCLLRCTRVVGQHNPWLRRLSDFQRKKLGNEFDRMYDRNGDGHMDAKDVTYFKRSLRSYVDSKLSDKTKREAYEISFDEYFEHLRKFADDSTDGRISRKEWLDFWDATLSHGTLPEWVHQVPDLLFSVMDASGDEQISSAEYHQFWQRVGGYPEVDDQKLEECFQVLTKNGTEQLDKRRFVKLYNEFYLSDDPTSPSRYIAGPMKL